MRRLLHHYRFSIDVEVLCAGDFDRPTLARLLTQLATAGLHGMVTHVTSVELDGERVGAEIPEPDERVRMLRPPPDERIIRTFRELEAIVETMRVIVSPMQEAVA